VTLPEKAEGPAADRTPRTATTTNQAASIISSAADSVDEMLATIRRFENAARVIADDKHLTIKARCAALLDLMARARKREGAAFLELAIWRGCAHLFEEEVHVPVDPIGAIRLLRRQGLESCPSCRRPLPDHDQLDYWRRLTHDSILRRPA
jgi:hypothetical protein